MNIRISPFTKTIVAYTNLSQYKQPLFVDVPIETRLFQWFGMAPRTDTQKTLCSTNIGRLVWISRTILGST